MIVRLKLEALTISFQVFLGDGHTSDHEVHGVNYFPYEPPTVVKGSL